MKKVTFSIIIPTYNSEKFLSSCLESIKQQNFPYYEIIIVDQHSSDNTIQIAKKYNAIIVFSPKPDFYSPPSASRNKGAKKAKGTYLYHLDSDMQLSKNLLKEADFIFTKKKNVGAIMVPEEDITKGFFSKCKALERLCYRGNDRIDSARVVKKEIFMKVKGYDESISSGEDFSIQEKYKQICDVTYTKNVVYHDLRSLTLFKSVKKKFNYGKTASTYFKTSKRSGGDIVKEEIFMYLKNYKLLLSHPFLAIGMVVLKSLEISAGLLGYIKNGL